MQINEVLIIIMRRRVTRRE